MPTLLTSAAGEGTGNGGWVRWGLSSPTSPDAIGVSRQRMRRRRPRSLPPLPLPFLACPHSKQSAKSARRESKFRRCVQIFKLLSKNLIYSAETLTVIRVSTLGRAPIRYRRESLLANDYADRLPDTVFAGSACIPRHGHFLPGAIGGANRPQFTNRNRPRASKYGRRHDNGLTPN
jgi:hypothetical protein